MMACMAAKAQTKDYQNSIGIIGGLTQYNGDLGQGFYKSGSKAFGGLSYSRYINSHFDFVFNATMGRWGYQEKNKTRFDAALLQGNVHLRVKLLNSDDNKVVPFIFGGIGVANYSDYELKTATGTIIQNAEGKGTDLYVPYGAGLQIQLSSRLNLLVQETFAYTDHDTRDGEENQNNESFLLHTIGLSYNFGAAKDADKDGVNDNKDKCPDTRTGVKVDNKGCPVDRDGDMIADFLDSCPDIKGTFLAHGCPDKDVDGVADKDDQCPDEAGAVELRGCPDKDGDKVADKDDRCADVAGSVQNKGCPDDKDGDGISDNEDACPDVKGTLELKGCADTDGDGIADNLDKCPNEKGTPANSGCPDINAETQLNNLLFGSNKDAVVKSHYQTLDKVVKVMTDNPSLQLTIEGHADNKGSAAVNLMISQKRAKAALNYLMKKGLAANRLKATGLGDKQPAASNDTEAGRAQNRRVELKVK